MQITINGDSKGAVDASKQVRAEYALLNSELKTGIQQAAYGINAGTVAISNSYINMSVVARSRMQELNNSAIRDAISFNDRIKQLANENKRLEGEISNSFEEWKQAHGLGSEKIQSDTEKTSDSIGAGTIYAALKYGALGIAATMAADVVYSAYQKMEEGAKRYRDQAGLINAASASTGLPSGDIQSYQVASRAAGLDGNAFRTAVENIAKAQTNLSDETNKTRAALDAMGISLTDQTGKSREAISVLYEVAERFSTYEDGTKKAALANDILGTSQGAMILWFNKGGAALQQYLNIATEVGSKMSAEELAHQQSVVENERIIQEVRAAANAQVDRGFAQIRESLVSSTGDWQNYSTSFGQIADGIVNIWAGTVNSIKAGLGIIQKVGAQANVAALNAGLGPAGIIESVGGSVIPGASFSGGKAPQIYTTSDFDKSLTQQKNLKGNILTWESAQTEKYWKDAYDWAAAYYGKESALAQSMWNKYADAARAAQKTTTSSGGSGADPFGIEQLREKIHQIQAEFKTMYREMDSQQYTFWSQEAESQGRYYDAARVKNWSSFENAVASISQQTLKAQTDLDTLWDKLNSDRGADPAVIEKIKAEIATKEELIALDKERLGIAKKIQEQALEKSFGSLDAQVATLKVSYAELTGNMEAQLSAQLALIDANMRAKQGDEWRTASLDKLGEAYRTLALEQERQIQINRGDLGHWEAIKQGIADATNAYDTFDASLRKNSKELVTNLNSEFSSFFQKAWKDELKTAADYFDAFCTAIENAFSKAISNIMADWMTSGLKSAFSGGGLGDLLGGLLGFGGSGGGGSFDNSSQISSALTFHGGGIVGRDGTYRTVPASVFAGAPRLHSGLAPDEFAAILQTGEEVRSRAQVQADRSGSRNQAVNVQVSIDNQSSTPLKLEQNSITQNLDKIVIGIVAKDIEQYGTLGQMLKNRK